MYRTYLIVRQIQFSIFTHDMQSVFLKQPAFYSVFHNQPRILSSLSLRAAIGGAAICPSQVRHVHRVRENLKYCHCPDCPGNPSVAGTAFVRITEKCPTLRGTDCTRRGAGRIRRAAKPPTTAHPRRFAPRNDMVGSARKNDSKARCASESFFYYTSSMIAISAASPRRGPMRVTLV